MKKRIMGLMAAALIAIGGVGAFAEEAGAALTFDGFAADLAGALEVRYQYVHDMEQAGDEAVTEKEIALEAAEQEWERLAKYETASFQEDGVAETTNEEYLRREYLAGLKAQAELDGTLEEIDFWKAWDAAYLRRAAVLEELDHVYSDQMKAYGEETEWYQTVIGNVGQAIGGYCGKDSPEDQIVQYQIQALINAARTALEMPGEALTLDGEAGRMTVAPLKRVQEKLGMAINGVVNQEQLDLLVAALAEKGYGAAVDQANVSLAAKADELAADGSKLVLTQISRPESASGPDAKGGKSDAKGDQPVKTDPLTVGSDESDAEEDQSVKTDPLTVGSGQSDTEGDQQTAGTDQTGTEAG